MERRRREGTRFLSIGAGLAGFALLAPVAIAFQMTPRPAGPIGASAIAANDQNLFLLQGGTLTALDPVTLRVRRSTVLPPETGLTGAYPIGPPDLGQLWSQGRAEGEGPVRLSHLPLRTEDIAAITPMGLMVHGHVTPSDHLGISPRELNVPPDRYEVISPADGAVVWVQRIARGNPDPGVQGRRYQGEYWMVIEHSRRVYSLIGLIEQLDPQVLAALGGDPGPGPGVNLRLNVKAGQTVGKMGGGHGLDYSLVDLSVTRKGWVKPERFWSRDPAKPHIVDPFDSMTPALLARARELNPRKVPPLGGKVDFDVPGRLAGNWYRADSGGYAGLNRRLDYWVGHLAFAYHHIDPIKVVVSIGDYEGRPRQFWVRGNTPDPTTVGEKNGLIRYELVFPALGSNGRRYEGIDTERVLGTVLVQVLPGNRIRFEAFPNRTREQVAGFTSSAAEYER